MKRSRSCGHNSNITIIQIIKQQQSNKKLCFAVSSRMLGFLCMEFCISSIASFLEFKDTLCLRTCAKDMLYPWTIISAQMTDKMWPWPALIHCEKNILEESSFFPHIISVRVTNVICQLLPPDNRLLSNQFYYIPYVRLGGHYVEGPKIGTFPPKLKTLLMNDGCHWWNGKVAIGFLPNTLTKLTTSISFEQRLESSMFPSNLKTLDLGTFSQYILPPNVLPSSLTSLKLCLNQMLEKDIIPSNVTCLDLNFCGLLSSYKLSCDMLPPSLLQLKLKWGNNGMCIKSLPSSLTCLSFPTDFACWVSPGVLPPNLRSLDMGYHHPIDNGFFPQSLLSLQFCCWTINPFHPGIYINILPLQPGIFPPNLKSLSLQYIYCDSTDFTFSVNVLPLGLQHLSLISNNLVALHGVLPESLQSLNLSNVVLSDDIQLHQNSKIEQILFNGYTVFEKREHQFLSLENVLKAITGVRCLQ